MEPVVTMVEPMVQVVQVEPILCCNTELKEIYLILCREGKKNVCHLQFVSSCLLGTSGLPQLSSVQSLSCVQLYDTMD